MHQILCSFALLLLLAPGCGTSLIVDCNGACSRLYDEDECGIQRPGMDQDEVKDVCLEYCSEAAGTSGEVGDYDPYTQSGPGDSVYLENRAQAQLWTECVEETACDLMSEGYCAPIY